VTDYLPEERARGITITAAAITFPWAAHCVNLIDTPGHADFAFEVARSLRVLDGVIAIIDGVAGVEAQTEKVWRQADEWNLSRIAFVNKLDRSGASFGRAVSDMIRRLKMRPLILQLPVFEHGLDGGQLQGIVDLVELKVISRSDPNDNTSQISAIDIQSWPNSSVQTEAVRAREAMLETLAEFDDDFLETYLNYSDRRDISAMSIHKAIRSITLRRLIVPVFCGASLRDIGVQPLLDAVVNYLPSPFDVPPPAVQVASAGSKSSLDCFPDHTCALAFKVICDPLLGPLVFVRVYRGVLTKGMTLINTRSREKEKATRLLRMYADESVDLDSIQEGDIGVIVGMKSAVTGDTIISKRFHPPFQLQAIPLPPPAFISSIEPESLGETKSVSDSIQMILREDPSLSYSTDDDSGQILLGGMGELHLEIARNRLVHDFHAKCQMSKVRVSYRETISTEVEYSVEKTYDREINGRHTRVGLNVTVSSLDKGILQTSSKQGRRFWDYGNCIEVDMSRAHALTTVDEGEAAEAIYGGSRAALQSSSALQLPIHSVLVKVSKLQAFERLTTYQSIFTASRLATQEALANAIKSKGPTLMEPYMKVQVIVPEVDVGSVISDLSSSKGGLILSLNTEDQLDVRFPSTTDGTIYLPPDSMAENVSHETSTLFATISARVPLKEMIGYDKTLRSITQGRGTFIMSLEGFEKMSGERASRVLRELTGIEQ